MIRDDADTCWLACQMQHSRITTPGPAVINDPRSATIQRRIDVDLFIVSLNRLHAVARLAAELADPRNVLPAALDQFSDRTWPAPTSVQVTCNTACNSATARIPPATNA